MPGGLIQIASYGSQDLYLTGTPEITFFKIVYRRHTNFSTESIEVPFDSDISFGEESTLTIPKIGDMIKNVYLKIIIPKLDFKKTPNSSLDISQALTDWNDAITNNQYVEDYLEIMIEAFRRAYDDNLAENVLTSGELYDTIELYFSDGAGYLTEIDNFTNIPENKFTIDKSNMRSIASSYDPSNTENHDSAKINLYNKLLSGIKECNDVQKFYYYEMINRKETYYDLLSENLSMAWVKKLGHSIIDYAEVTIGGNRIDKQYGDWLNIWHELTGNDNTELLYNRMIGNVSEITTLNRDPKPKYTLYIPLQFWFCRNNGLALPLISLQYHEVSINVKFKDFKDCAYMEANKLVLYPNYEEELYLDELGINEGVYLEASMLVDYVYLDSSERRRFAQSSHEYLIEQVQVREFIDINLQNYSALLDFNHPCKELIWVAQQIPYTENNDGYTECHWTKYTSNESNVTTTDKYTGNVTTTTDYSGNLVTNSQIDFNGHSRVIKMNGDYFNYVQPYAYHTRTPDDGINVYSFSLNPEKHQPSGQCNMSRLSNAVLNLEFNKEIFDNAPDLSRIVNLRIYTINYNILRFISGMAGCAYSV